MSENERIQALELIDKMEHQADDYGDLRMIQFSEEDADLLRKAVSQVASGDGGIETTLILFVGWLRGHRMVDVGWDDDQQLYTLKPGGPTIVDFVRSFLGERGEQQG